ncbi:HAUS augmin-like complex subunit 6 N-terminus-domain-containing protein [Geopyxis carbonaria]|nr:HAUS augmin-like complex subunit 6 N-terminus-domain-containing protein [Geopyxis carbonaria]
MKPSAAVSLLLTNLRLLDYDSDSPDSFPITPDVFTSLTNKGKAFEHIIHHLFRSFDPDECELRLQGCWPVYEPAQSRDLRNIVFKWLEDLKAGGRLNGVLIRRTALDDCCGQRYEELLLALSTMVLKEKIEGGAFQDVRNTFAYNQATSLEPSKAHLTTLNIAHRYSLTSLLKSRERSKAQWSSFSSLLDEKEVEIAAISKVLSEAEPEEPPKATRRGYEEAIRAKWRNNWLGDPKWLEIILNGDPDAGRDHLMEWPFERAIEKHHYFKNGQSMPSIPGVASLKELDKKVELQQQRVAEMRKLREMAGFSSTRPNTKSPSKSDGVERVEKKGLKLEFKLHQKLNLKEAATTVPRKERGRENEYRELLDQLQEELIQAGAPQNRAREAPTTGQYYSYRQDVDMAEDSHMLDQSSQVYHLNINMVEPMSNRESNEDVSMLDGDVSMLDADMSYQDGTKDDGLLHEAYSTRSPSLQLRLSPSPSPSPNRSPIPTKMISRQIDEYEPDSIPTSGSSGASMLGGSDEEMSEMEPTPPFLSRMSTPGGKPRLAPPVDFGDYATPERPNSHARKSAVGLGVAFGDDEMLAEQVTFPPYLASIPH